MYESPLRAYEEGAKTSSSSRDLESSALFKAARVLEACQNSWQTADRPTRLAEALRHNLRLWTLFQVELAEPDNQLPADLRVNLLRLSSFVDRRTFEIMADPRPEKLQALIDINRQIASGLANKPE
jgi:flagellar biosynthesis activator protein FlaF